MKTNCAKNCSSEDEGKCQPFPKNGPLEKNMNLSLEDLKKKLNGKTGQLYIYILTTVQKKDNDRLIQTASAPNFQGGYITLCSCKHRMRTFREPIDWQNIWIAGFANNAADNRLFYLMKVQEAYESQFDIWNKLPREVRDAKDASTSKYGDLFKPKDTANCNEYDPNCYVKPCNEHVHAENESTEWHADIDSDIMAKINKTTKGVYSRKASMLVGAPELSFLWEKLIIKKPNKEMENNNKNCSKCKNLTRYAQGERVCDIQSFLACLEKTNK